MPEDEPAGGKGITQTSYFRVDTHGVTAVPSDEVVALLTEACQRFTAEAGMQPGWEPFNGTLAFTMLHVFERVYLRSIKHLAPTL